MLPSELLVARTRRGRVFPVFARLNDVNLDLASTLIETVKDFVGKKQGELSQVIGELEVEWDVDHRLIRGLRTLLLRRCEFGVKSLVEPIRARRSAFQEANKIGPITSEEKRRTVLQNVAESLKISVDELEASLWADYESELILVNFDAPSPEELLRRYNLSLAQTLLFKAMSMDVSISAHRDYKGVFRRIKYLGLMYLVEKRDGGLIISVEGPLSLFKMTEKYGTSMAKLLPIIVESEDWKITAKIVMRGYDGTPRIRDFELDSGYNDSLKVEGGWRGQKEEKPIFDSSVEEKFARGFNSLQKGWILTREPEPLIAGNSVFIPDFGFRKRGMNFYLEVVGFWTEDYLKKKLYKLSLLEEDNLILAVDENLACSKFKELEGRMKVIYYKKEIPVKEVYGHLKGFEMQNTEREIKYLASKGIELEGDVIDLRKLASGYDVGVEAIKALVKGDENYVLVGDELVSKVKVKGIESKLERLPSKEGYSHVVELLEGEGISNIDGLLKHLGYETKWISLDPDSVVVIKKR
ncbi:MAG: DUF790 family protein [Candidatus Hydrothermarchaeales archaeon]